MNVKLLAAACTAASLLAAAPAWASFAEVVISGTVDFNQINSGTLGNAQTGDAVEISFRLDSRVFDNSTNFPVRGYDIDMSSFNMTIGGDSIGLVNPYPAGVTPYFILRNDDPAVDGFFLGSNIDGFPNGVALDQAGNFDQFFLQFSVTYTGDTLSSLNIFDAVGTYDFDNLTVFNMSITDGPFEAMFMNFESMSIEKVGAVVPLPGAWLMMVSGLAVLGRWRKRVA